MKKEIVEAALKLALPNPYDIAQFHRAYAALLEAYKEGFDEGRATAPAPQLLPLDMVVTKINPPCTDWLPHYPNLGQSAFDRDIPQPTQTPYTDRHGVK